VTEVEEEETTIEAVEEREEFAFNGKMVTADMETDADSSMKMEAETEVDLIVVEEAGRDLTVEVEVPEDLEDPDPQNPDKEEADHLKEVKVSNLGKEENGLRTRKRKLKEKEADLRAKVIKKTGDQRASLFD